MSEGKDASSKPDSPANNGPISSDRDWRLYGSKLEDYNTDFRTVLGHRDIGDLVRSRPNPVVIDALAPSETLAELFSFLPQPDKLGIAITLEDLRTVQQKERDERLGIHQVSGDITNPMTLNEVASILGRRKADLIIERGWYGLDNLPLNPSLYNMGLSLAWRVLSEADGSILGQLPPEIRLQEAGINFSRWIKQVKDMGIHAKYDPRPYGTFILTKTEKSPNFLPSLV
jgi:hypothetical protein